MKKMMVLFILIASLLCPCALAQEKEYLMTPPPEVLDYLESRFSAYSLEDYCEVVTLDALYGFALMTAGEERVLVGFRENDGKLAYWLKNHGAVPQGEEPAWFSLYERGVDYETFVDMEYTTDGDEFSITQLDELGETYDDSVMFHYDRKEKTFRLISYKKDITNTVWIGEGELVFGGICNGYEGRVPGKVQTDIRYLSYAALPQTMHEARRELTSAPKLERGVFEPKEIKFTGGKKYPVYTGPGEHYARSGNGKGMVSTNDWIQVFGRLDEWIMIQYDISADQYRIGWITADALPKGAQVKQLEHLRSGLGQTYWQDVQTACMLTDDPFNSAKAIALLEKGALVRELVYDYMGWSYIWVEIGGEVYCGFVPAECISHG